ncbi:MAG: ABC transporter substrate-binding protein [Phycisphaeraceae bacterium]|nr:ABC transporter substrate-binding protein [Phycisphaeraceae bacterium]
MRIVSLVPSATEILALVAGPDALVGRSHECDHPSEIRSLPILTAPLAAYDPSKGMPAAVVDQRVRSQAAAGSSLYTLNEQLLEELRPDLIVTQALCSVCSVDPDTVFRAARAIGDRTGATPKVITLDPKSVDDVLDDILRIGAVTGAADRARDLVVHLNHRMLAAQEWVNPYLDQHVVGFLEWTDPLFIAGHWNVQLIERAGGLHPLNPTTASARDGAAAGLQQAQRTAKPSRRVSTDDFARVSPGAIIVAPCGLDLAQTVAETRALLSQPWFAELPAVRQGRVAIVDGNQMFNRPGPRLVDAFEFLVGWLHECPELIPEGFPWLPMARLSPN